MEVIQERGHCTKQTRAPRLSAEAWASNRDVIERLYSKDNLRLKDVMHLMREQHGFCASRRQYEYHLALWQISKYTPRRNNIASGTTRLHDLRHDGIDAESMTDLPTDPVDLSHSTEGTSTDFHEMSNLFPPMLWNDEETFNFIEQELAAFSHQHSRSSIRNDVSNGSLAQFSNCNFTNLDRQPYEHHHSESQTMAPLFTGSEHHWQTPGALSRLWELEAPASQRTAAQQYRVQKLMWCLWLCGNQDCFVNLARGVQYRIVRVEDDISRFESDIEAWIETSTGSLSSTISSSSRNHKSAHDAFDNPNSSLPGVTLPRLQVENSVGGWRKHASLGHQLAMLRATGKINKAKKLALRLASDLKSAPGKRAFFSFFETILRFMQKCLAKEIRTLRSLETDVRDFVKSAVEPAASAIVPDDAVLDEKKVVGVVAFLCYHRWTQTVGYSPERVAYIEASTGFPVNKIFQWLSRILVFHSKHEWDHIKTRSQATISFSPTSLCSRALNGLSAISLFERSECISGRDDIGKEDDTVVDRLAIIWVDWLARDSEWFLPPVLPMNLADSPINVWQSIH